MVDAAEYWRAPIEVLDFPVELVEEVQQQQPVERSSRREMASKFGGVKFEVEKYDGRSDYLLWEKQVKGVLRAMGLDHLLSTREEYDGEGEEVISEKKWL